MLDARGVLWIQTDAHASQMNKGELARIGNNQMLACDRSTGEMRRFLTGPVNCEITGATMTPDGRTMFINIQHPGESPSDRSDPAEPSKYSTLARYRRPAALGDGGDPPPGRRRRSAPDQLSAVQVEQHQARLALAAGDRHHLVQVLPGGSTGGEADEGAEEVVVARHRFAAREPLHHRRRAVAQAVRCCTSMSPPSSARIT